MSSILSKENIDIVALTLDRAELAEKVTALQLLEHFELIDGFWGACVEMTAPASKDLPNLPKRRKKSHKWRAGSREQILENGIRDQTGNLAPSFCDWFGKHCSFDAAAETRKFLLPHLRPAEFAELHGVGSLTRQNNLTKSAPLQLQTKFANAVIEAMNLPAELSASEVYPDFARKAVELADEQEWPQDLMVEIEKGTGILLVSYTTTGSASRVTKKVSTRRFTALLSSIRTS